MNNALNIVNKILSINKYISYDNQYNLFNNDNFLSSFDDVGKIALKASLEYNFKTQ